MDTPKDKNMEKIIKMVECAEEILIEHTKLINKDNKTIEDMLKKYDRVLRDAKTAFSQHEPLFKQIYITYKSEILSLAADDVYDDGWLKKGIHIWFGEKIERVKKMNIKFMISIIYGKALEIRNHLSKKLTGIEERDKIIFEDFRYLLADEMIYWLIEIFISCLTEREKSTNLEKLNNIASHYAEQACINISKPENSNNDGGGLGSIFAGINKLMGGEEGDEMPEGLGNIPNIMQGVLKNKGLLESFNDIKNDMQGFDGNSDPGEMASRLLNRMGPVIGNAFKGMNSNKTPDGVHVSEEGRKQQQEKADEVAKNLSEFGIDIKNLNTDDDDIEEVNGSD